MASRVVTGAHSVFSARHRRRIQRSWPCVSVIVGYCHTCRHVVVVDRDALSFKRLVIVGHTDTHRHMIMVYLNSGHTASCHMIVVDGDAALRLLEVCVGDFLRCFLVGHFFCPHLVHSAMTPTCREPGHEAVTDATGCQKKLPSVDLRFKLGMLNAPRQMNVRYKMRHRLPTAL